MDTLAMCASIPSDSDQNWVFNEPVDEIRGNIILVCVPARVCVAVLCYCIVCVLASDCLITSNSLTCLESDFTK